MGTAVTEGECQGGALIRQLQNRADFFEWFFREQHPHMELPGAAGLDSAARVAMLHSAWVNLQYKACDLFNGKPVDKENLEITITGAKLVLAIRCAVRAGGDHRLDTLSFYLGNVPPHILAFIREQFAENVTTHVPVNRRIVDTFNPLVYMGTITDGDGRPITGAVADELTAQRLVSNAPVIVELIRFIRAHKNNPEKIQLIRNDHTGAVDYYRLSVTVPELTGGLRGKAAAAVIEELRSLVAKPMQFLLTTENAGKVKGKRKRKSPILKTGLIAAATFNTVPMILDVSSWIMRLEEGFKMLPADLRERWARYFGRRKLHHEMAWGWAYQAQREVHREGVDKLIVCWGLSGEAKNPKRLWERFESCCQFLKETGVALEIRTVRKKNGRPEMMEFRFDRKVMPFLQKIQNPEPTSITAGD